MLYNITPGANRGAFKVGGDNAVIANKGEGLHNGLAIIAWVRQRLAIPRHAGREYDLCHDLVRSAKPLPFEYLAVFQY